MRSATRPFTALALAACLQLSVAAQSSVVAPDVLEAARTITQKNLQTDLEFLASDEMRGRDTPSPELDRAADWIAARFKSLKLSPAFGKSWFQGRHFGVRERTKGKLVTADATVELGPDQVRVAGNGLQAAETWKVVSMSVPSKRSEVSAAGDLKDRAVLLEPSPASAGMRRFQRMRMLRTASRWLQEAGVRALVLPPDAQVTERVFRGATMPMIYLDAPLAVPEGGLKGASLTLQVPRSQAPFARNVGGFIQGSDPKLKSEVIVFSAHYDHIGVRRGSGDVINNGADDDGSGTVSVMAVAAAMKKLPKAPARTTLFLCFYGEEKGFLGSRLYCDEPAFPLANTRAVFNIEMVGRPDDIGPDCAWITGWSLSDFGEIIAPAGKELGIRFYENKKGRLSQRLFGASDNQPFAARGVPAHSISAGSLHRDYHRPSDETDKIDFKNMTRVVRAIFAAGATMAHGDRVPKWKPGNRYAEAGKKLRK